MHLPTFTFVVEIPVMTGKTLTVVTRMTLLVLLKKTRRRTEVLKWILILVSQHLPMPQGTYVAVH